MDRLGEGKMAASSAVAAHSQVTVRRTHGLLLLTLLLATGYHWHLGGGWNVMTRIGLIRAIVHDHTLSINRSHERTGDKAEYPPGSGIYYSDKPIGAQVLGLVGYVIGYGCGRAVGGKTLSGLETGVAVATWLAVGLPTVAASLLMLGLLREFGLGLRQAAFLTLAYALGTLAWPYSTVYYGHQAAAAFGFIGFWFAWRAARSRGVVPPAVAGLFAGWAVATEFPALIIAAGLFVYIARGGLSKAAAFAVGSVPFVALQLAYNWACFGSPLRFGYMFEVQPEFSQAGSWLHLPRPEALWGITLSADKGLFVLSPFLLFAVWGLWLMVRDRAWRAEGLVATAVVVLYVAYNSAHYMWQGGICFGPRHIVPMLPFLCLGLGWAWPRLPSFGRLVCGVLVGWGTLVMFAAVNTIAEPAYQMVTGSPGPLEALVRLSLGVVEWPTLGLALGLPTWASPALHALLVALPVVWLWRVTGSGSQGAGLE